ncbi:vanadium-dependent haloperoxidase [Streptomyces flavidovirens]|uniref:vanadium-dependent haloperoxidase n=1 Tax=Streptomyces flavidovirens TaxID=67298 RepID=UPI000408C1C5|nr:vanadium-dependent haloperoxidase [Streptomyces flavidovirens]
MRLNRPVPSRSPRPGVRAALGILATLALVAVPGTAGPTATAADNRRAPSADPAALRHWNTIATQTISANLGAMHPSGQVAVWHGFVSAAVYNAVVGIQGRYAPYRWKARGPATASPEAAAVTAAHRVLLAYFPASQPRLDTEYAKSLAKIPDGRAEKQGVAYGERAADHIVKLREGDGRYELVEYTAPPEPGLWRPTPPAHQPFTDAWLGTMRPLLLESPHQFRPGAPPALSSARYARDVNEIKAMGGSTGSSRTARQTETALFFGGNLIAQFQTAFRDYAVRHGLGIADTARLFAAANTSAADAVITAWDSKLHYGFWRPISAVHLADTDDNPDTTADPGWQPLLVTPPHPDYISGHTAVAGAVLRTVAGILGTSRLGLHVASETTTTKRRYEYADQINKDMIDARVWGGIHFRSADTAGCDAGLRIGDWALAHYFRPLRQAVPPGSRPAPASQASPASHTALPQCPR